MDTQACITLRSGDAAGGGRVDAGDIPLAVRGSARFRLLQPPARGQGEPIRQRRLPGVLPYHAREECNYPSADSVAVLVMPHALDTVVGAWLLRVSRSGRCSTTYGRGSIGRAWMLATCGALMHALWQWLWWIPSCGATMSESWTRSRWSCRHKALLFCPKTHQSGGDWYMSEYTSI